MTRPSIPIDLYAHEGETLMRWMGSFWSTIHEDPDFLRCLHESGAIASAQEWLDILEIADSIDRKTVPVLSRERWYPIILLRSRRGVGGAATLKIGMDPIPVVGPQTDPAFPANSVFQLGGDAVFSDVVTYPLSGAEALRDVACIVDSIAAPRVALVRDRDFTLRGGSIALRKACDPFGEKSVFVAEDVRTGDGDDKEVCLWACDALFDRERVYDRLGCALGVRAASTEYSKRLLNAIWDMIVSGASPELFASALGALCDVPTIETDGEKVETIATDTNGDKLVITDKRVYRLPPNAELRESVVAGATLGRGSFLDFAIRIYPTFSDPRPIKMSALSECGARVRADVPTLALSSAFFAAPLKHGLHFSWGSVPISSSGVDANGNPKLWFPIDGSAADMRAFWESTWARCEAQNISMKTLLADYLGDFDPASDVLGWVEPLEFVFRNLLGANALVATLDVSRMRNDAWKESAPAFVSLLRRALPSYVYLFFVERRSTPVDAYATDTLTRGDRVEKRFGSVRESSGQVGEPSLLRLTFNDCSPHIRWVATCREVIDVQK